MLEPKHATSRQKPDRHSQAIESVKGASKRIKSHRLGNIQKRPVKDMPKRDVHNLGLTYFRTREIIGPPFRTHRMSL